MMARSFKKAGKPIPTTPNDTAALAEELEQVAQSLLGEVEAQSAVLARNAAAISRARGVISPPRISLGRPWDAWISGLPEEDRADGFHACALWRDMIDLRNRLRDAIDERAALAGVMEGEAQRVTDVRMMGLRSSIERCEKGYRTYAEPFFARHGRPPLAEVDLHAAQRTRALVAFDDFERRVFPTPGHSHEGEAERAWETWLRRLPKDRRSEAFRVRVLYDDLALLRERLLEELDELRRGSPEARTRIEAMKPELAHADLEYRTLAEPLFGNHGKPDLVE